MTRRPDGGAVRKAIHVVVSLGAAVVVYALEPIAAAVVLAVATLVALNVELARRVSPGFAAAFRRWLGGMLKEREQIRLTGATTLAVGFTIAAVLFPGAPALGAILFVGLADPAAAIVGTRWGHRRYPGGKSAAGSFAFFVVVLALAVALGSGRWTAFLVAGTLTLVEAFSFRVDDNLYLPAAGAAALVLVGGMAGP